MRNLTYAAFCVLLLAGFGCAITNYDLITDNNQTAANEPPNHPVNTNGKAHMLESSQIATIWPEGTDELFNMVDQKANGDRTLSTYNNFSTGDQATFHDDLYCNPDWQGCAIFTAPDPEVGDDDIFDGTFNASCSGARSLSILVSTPRFYGECGRVDKVPLESKLALLSLGLIAERHGRQGLLYNWGRSNLTVTLENESGQSYNAPIVGGGSFWFAARENLAMLDMTNSLIGNSIGWFANYQDQHATPVTTVTICYNGICTGTQIAGQHPVASGSRIRANKNARF